MSASEKWLYFVTQKLSNIYAPVKNGTQYTGYIYADIAWKLDAVTAYFMRYVNDP